jgi:hypothetical protein
MAREDDPICSIYSEGEDNREVLSNLLAKAGAVRERFLL